jgi:succinate-acetate transporter protein
MSKSPEEVRQTMRPPLSVAALPSILGMYAFAAATFIVAAHMAHWYGNAQSAIVLFPLVLIFGGLAQFCAGAWSLRANDAVASAMHCTWGSFWTAYGILQYLSSTGRLARPEGAFSELGFWFIVVAAITWAVTAASRENRGISSLLALLAVGSTLEAIAELTGVEWLRMLSGYFLMASALVAWYVASTLMIRFGKMGKTQPATPLPRGESVRAA